MAGYDSLGFEIPQRFDLGGFPKPRGKRTGPVPAPQEELTAQGGQPFSRVWNAYIRQFGAGTRTIRASPAMIGPGIVTSLSVRHDPIETGGTATSWAVGWSDTKPTEQFKGAQTVIPPGQVITETDFFNDNVGALSMPFGTEGHEGQNGMNTWPITYIVDAPVFYLWIACDSINFNASVFWFMLSVLNQVPRRALANYTG